MDIHLIMGILITDIYIYIYPYGVMAIHQDRTYNPTLHIL